jgi:hypothetical protein
MDAKRTRGLVELAALSLFCATFACSVARCFQLGLCHAWCSHLSRRRSPAAPALSPRRRKIGQGEAAVTDAKHESEHLGQANRHIAQAQKYIGRQKKLID